MNRRRRFPAAPAPGCLLPALLQLPLLPFFTFCLKRTLSAASGFHTVMPWFLHLPGWLPVRATYYVFIPLCTCVSVGSLHVCPSLCSVCTYPWVTCSTKTDISATLICIPWKTYGRYASYAGSLRGRTGWILRGGGKRGPNSGGGQRLTAGKRNGGHDPAGGSMKTFSSATVWLGGSKSRRRRPFILPCRRRAGGEGVAM